VFNKNVLDSFGERVRGINKVERRIWGTKKFEKEYIDITNVLLSPE
jgi:hypothetical protein